MKYYIDSAPRWENSRLIGAEISKDEARALLLNEYVNAEECLHRLEVEGIVNLPDYVLSIEKECTL